jgi:hypothetical protein
MDIWGIILAVAQVAAAAKHDEVQVLFERGESAPMERFHKIGQVLPDARYGHIVVTFNVALLRQEIKELQQGIAHRRHRARPEHRSLYDVLEEHLVAGNQELEDDMDFFTTSERKERTFWRMDCRRPRSVERRPNTQSQEDGGGHKERLDDRG